MGTITDILDALVRLNSAVIYFLGATDTGKTSLILRLANELAGRSVAILDGDIGQSGILPMTISLLKVVKPFDALPELPLIEQEFIPGYNLLRCVERNARTIGEMTKHARRWAKYCLIDTTGFVEGPGIRLKRREIEEIRPDLIIGLYRSQELDPILERVKCRTLSFPVSGSVIRRSSIERRERRHERLTNYFKDSYLREAPASTAVGTLNSHNNKVVGLYGERFLGLGIVKSIDDEKTMVLTPVSENIQRIEFTNVMFSFL